MKQGPTCCAHGIQGYGADNPQIVLVGIAPGRDEATRSKRPFTGQSGKLLDAVLSAHGIARDSVYCTNLICYWKDAPSQSEIATCRARLMHELYDLHPRVIVPLGKLACESLIGMSFGDVRGAVIHRPSYSVMLSSTETLKFDQHYVLGTYHPAAALHKNPVDPRIAIDAAYDLVADLSKLPMILDGYYEQFQKPTYTLVDTAQEANKVLLTLHSPISIDIETNLDKEADEAHPFDHDITCIGIADNPDHAYVLTQSALTDELEFPDKEYVPHYGTFDMVQIKRKLDKWLRIGGDTYYKSSVFDERSGRGRHKLKPLARQWTGADFYEVEEHKEVGTPEFYQYNANDVCHTYRLDQFLEQRLREDGTDGFYRDILIPLENTLAHSQYRGIYVNPQTSEKMKSRLGVELYVINEDLKELAKELGYADFNPNSPQQLIKLFAAVGVTLTSTAKATLDDLDHPLASKIRRYRTLYKLIKVYLFDVAKQLKYDGRVHPHTFLTGTMRLIYTDPDMQTLPKPKTVKDLGVIRSIFTATNDDYVLLEADYERIEGWVGAYLSQDDVLKADLESGDWHTATTVGCFGKTEAECDPYEWAHLRDGGKHINYGAMFEEQAYGLTRKPPIGIGCDLTTAQKYLNAWYSRYHTFDDWRKRMKRMAQNDGYIDTPFGYRRHFPLIVNEHQLRQAVNAPIQMTASGYSLTSAAKLEPLLAPLDTHLLFIEHDGLYYEVARKHLDEAVEVIRTTMEAPPLKDLPSVKVTVEVGNNLAELVKYANCKVCNSLTYLPKDDTCRSCS